MASGSRLHTPAWSNFPMEVDSNNGRNRRVHFDLPHSSISDSDRQADNERRLDFDDYDSYLTRSDLQWLADHGAWSREYEAEHVRASGQKERDASPAVEEVAADITSSVSPQASPSGATERGNSPQLITPVPLRTGLMGKATASPIPRRGTTVRSFTVDEHTGLSNPIQNLRPTRLRRRWSGLLESLTLPPPLDQGPGHTRFAAQRNVAVTVEEFDSMATVRHTDSSDDLLDIGPGERGRSILKMPSHRSSRAAAPSGAVRADVLGAWSDSSSSTARATAVPSIANERFDAHRDDRLTEFIIGSLGELRGRLGPHRDSTLEQQITTLINQLHEHLASRSTESLIDSIIEMLDQLHRRLTDERLQHLGSAVTQPPDSSISVSAGSSVSDLDPDASPLLSHEMLSVADIPAPGIPANHQHVQVLVPALSPGTQHLGSWARLMTQIAIGDHVMAHAEHLDLPVEPPPPYSGSTPSPPAAEIRLPSPGAESEGEESTQGEIVDGLTAALAARGLIDGDEAVVTVGEAIQGGLDVPISYSQGSLSESRFLD